MVVDHEPNRGGSCSKAVEVNEQAGQSVNKPVDEQVCHLCVWVCPCVVVILFGFTIIYLVKRHQTPRTSMLDTVDLHDYVLLACGFMKCPVCSFLK